MTTDIDYTPAPFSDGLQNWCSKDGTCNNDTYDIIGDSSYVPSDSDFGGCIELVKTQSLQKLRYTERTPMIAETYLRISTKVKLLAGNMPSIRIAAWAGDKNGEHVSSVTQIAPSTVLDSYGKVVEISAIVGPGYREGVDMVWGVLPKFGHFGLDLTGPIGSVVRIDDLKIEDISHVFQRDILNIVDVRDYGALGDGTTDNYDAFLAADAAAQGRKLVVPEGNYFIEQGISLGSNIEFEGTISMADNAQFVLAKSFNLPTYIDAFKNEALAFKKAFQALLNSADHDALDLGGRTISIPEPIDMQAAVGNRDQFTQRRVIRNGQFFAQGSDNWQNDIITSQATYSVSNPNILTGVVNIADIPVGSLIQGAGVGREVYVKSVNISAQQLELSKQLFDADGTQVFTFTRFKYILDFSGFEKISRLSLQDIEFQCNETANGVMLAKTGWIFQIRDCFFTKPAQRAITSIGTGCQGLHIDQCHFLTAEANQDAQDRLSIAINANSNDVKIRGNWASQFRHFAVLSGSNNIVSGNHFYQGDNQPNGVRTAGLVLAQANTSTTVVGNYIDNCSIEWTNEHDATPDFISGFGFSALSISDNVFLSGDVAPWFTYIVVKPFGQNHSLSNVTVNGNNFRSINGAIDRIERVDTTFAHIDPTRFRHIQFLGNNFNNISTRTENPVHITHTQNSDASVWRITTDGQLPFSGLSKDVEAIVTKSKIQNVSGIRNDALPFATILTGDEQSSIDLNWPTSLRGKIGVTIRCDT